MHPFFQAKRPLVFAHRGGGALAPENTVAAFDNAVALGADGLELDVHLSKDGEVVVHHDATLDRTTDRTGELRALTADELARADAGHRFLLGGEHPFRAKGCGIPALRTVLKRYPNHRIIVEMKVNRPDMARAVVDVVREADAIERVCLGSFGRGSLRAARALEARIATSAAREDVRWALYRSWCRWPIFRAPYDGYQVPEIAGNIRVISPRFVADARRAGLGVQVWTVDTEPDARRLLAWGVDGLITNRPDVIVPVLGSMF